MTSHGKLTWFLSYQSCCGGSPTTIESNRRSNINMTKQNRHNENMFMSSWVCDINILDNYKHSIMFFFRHLETSWNSPNSTVSTVCQPHDFMRFLPFSPLHAVKAWAHLPVSGVNHCAAAAGKSSHRSSAKNRGSVLNQPFGSVWCMNQSLPFFFALGNLKLTLRPMQMQIRSLRRENITNVQRNQGL